MRNLTAMLTLGLVTLACGDDGTLGLDPLGGPVTRVEVRADTDSLFRPGETTRVLSLAFDRSGRGIDRALSITWQSTDLTVFTVDGAGIVTAVGNGSATVIARAEGVEGRTTIAVAFGPPLANVTFADARLAACVAQLRLTYANQVQQLRCPDREIVSLAGIEALKRLNFLDLGTTNSFPRNRIRDLIPLASLQQLRTLFLVANGLTDIRPLAALINLNTLDLNLNELVDISTLSALTLLRNLYLYGNRISDLRPLSTLTGLRELSLAYNRIIDIGALGLLTTLQNLAIEGNEIRDAGPLRTLTALNTLDLSFNRVSDVSALSALPDLRDLRLARNPLDGTDVTALHTLPNLAFLNLDEIVLNGLGPLAGLTRLRYLSFQKASLGNVTPLAALTALQYLYLDDNLIVDVRPLAALTELLNLRLQRNRITTGVAALVTLRKAQEIQLSANPGIRCSELATLTGALGANVVKTSGGCAP